ncbi:MAG: hypothetical protein ABIJ09_05785 [Pseudomonadota bacterium]
MTSIRRNQFEGQHAGKSFKLDDVQNSPSKKAALEQGGVHVDDLRRADLNGDGSIDAGEAFKVADSYQRGSSGEAITLKEGGQDTKAGKALNALGLLLQSKIGATGDGGPAVNLDQIEVRFNRAARQIHKDPKAISGLAGEFKSIADELTPAIERDQAQLGQLQGELAGKETHLNWFEKNVGIFSPKEVRELRSQVGEVEDRLSTSKAFRSGAHLALRTGQDANPEMNPSTWSGRISSAASKISHSEGATPSREKAVSGLVKEQDKLGRVVDRAHLDKNAVNTDVDNFSQEVAWHQRWKWLDVVIGGESDKGALYRAGKDMNQSAGALVNELEGVRGQGEQRTQDEVSELLKLESPEYLSMRTQYDKLKPAHEGVNDVLRATDDAQGHLDDAEHWISRRNYLRSSEPVEFETVREPRYVYRDGQQVQDGYDETTRETSAHQSWQSDYDNAVNQARWATSSAEREVIDVNAKLPGLERALRNLEGGSSDLRLVDDEIGGFWGEMSSFGPWSYDSSQVDRIQHQLRRLDGQLNQIKGRVEPEYQRHDRYVSSKITERRGDLRSLQD